MNLLRRESRWEPLRELETMMDRYSRWMGLPARRGLEMVADGEWSPNVDISERDDAFMIQVELPGIQKKDIRVNICNGVLTIEGERHQSSESTQGRVHRVERSYGNFIRSFTLPRGVDEHNLKAHFHDGMLDIELPKTAEARAATIDVAVD
ncbi:MAG: Hsp20/alpha crystallin family protein [Cyanobacteriota bacterium]|nr:Hsp20/alpha crystallin family protein [Cyanobacteriota bacterium]